MGNIFTKRAGEDAGYSDASTPIDSNKIDTIIGPNSLIKGDLHSKGTLRVDGTVEGKLSSDSTVILGEKGVAKATITAQQVIIGGTVHGNVIAQDRLEILSTGRVYGDVQTASSRFIVAEGVIFEGRCTMGARMAEPASKSESAIGNAKDKPTGSPKVEKESSSKATVAAGA